MRDGISNSRTRMSIMLQSVITVRWGMIINAFAVIILVKHEKIL